MSQVAATTRVSEPPDTFDMWLVHGVFRRELHLLPAIVQAVPAGDRSRAAIVAAHQREIVGLLRHHQRGEEAMIWPSVRARAPLTDELAAAFALHALRVDGLITRCVGLADGWETAGDVRLREALMETLDQLARAVDEQLSFEERELIPLVEAHLSSAEWNELGDRGQQGRSKRNRLLTLGLMLEDASREDRSRFLAQLPFPARPVWFAYGRAWYRRYVRRVRVLGP